jgi:hypothetical protein
LNVKGQCSLLVLGFKTPALASGNDLIVNPADNAVFLGKP